MVRYTNDDGTELISCDYLSVGDYDGSGSVGEANIRALMRDKACKEEDSYIERSVHSFRQLWLLDTEENREIIKKLEEQYPLYDEEVHSLVETEWEEESWKDYVMKDLLRGLPDELGEVITDDLDEDCLWSIYKDAMDQTNTYPSMSYNSCSIDVKRIQEKFTQLVLERIRS